MQAGPGLESYFNITFLRGGKGPSTDFVTRLEVPSDFFPTTSEEKWRTGRWSPEGDGGVEEEELQFLARGLFQTSGVSVWWGAFPQCGNIPLLMTGSQIST